MKHFYSKIMVLAMMVAALEVTACGGDEEEDFDGPSKVAFTMIIDGDRHEYDSDYLSWMELMGTWESYTRTAFLKIDVTPLLVEFRLYYPLNTNPSSYFKVGYSSFEKDATEICIYGSSKYQCTYVKGSAKVIKNDGKNLTVKFSNYKFTWKDDSREIIFDGTLNFVLDY